MTVRPLQDEPVQIEEEKSTVELKLKPGYMYRESNREIGRIAERMNVQVRPYDRKDRFAAWRRKTAKKAKVMHNKNSKGK
jgi:hypothetical protein